MDSSPNLTLPYIIAAQAQKHVTHNEAIRGLDALVQLMALDKDLSSPPGSPSDGDRYIVGPSPTGAWTGHTAKVAAWQDGVWAFYPPRAGWLAWVADEDKLYVHDGAAWGQITVAVGTGASVWGVNATADSTNRLAVASTATLFDNVGNGHQAKINKAAAADTASLLFQTGYSGRTEMGTAGDDDFHFKVSADGSSWVEALVIDRSTGEVRLPHSARFLSGFAAPINCSLAASVAGNALTIAVAGADGNAPSAGNPVLIPFRSATASDGAPVWRSLAAALSLTVSAGSTLGAASGSAFRLWMVLFDDAGTLRLGVINCSTPTQIYPLPETLASSTAEAGTGGADSAGLIYTGSAVSSKAYRILGYMDWPSGLTTAGTWDAGPTTIKLFGPGDKKPGDLLQRAYAEYTANADLTAQIPSDDTIPQNTEGTQILSITLGAIDALAHVAMRWAAPASLSSGAHNVVAALFRDSGADAIAGSESVTAEAADYRRPAQLAFQERPGAGTFTYALRVGPSGPVTLRFNGYSSARTLGGTQRAPMTIEVFQG